MIKKLALKIPRAIQWRVQGVRAVRGARREFEAFQAASERSTRSRGRFPLQWSERLLCLGDRTGDHGFDAHYIYHPAWAARVLAQTRPQSHVDISSKLDFSTLVSAFVPVQFYDYRPAAVRLSGFSSQAADLMALPFEDESLPSISCMHVVEHIGLGRYGDPLDPDGDLKAMAELSRVLAPGGSLLFVTPVGRPRIMFNAHRIYGYDQVLAAFSGLQLRQFSLVPDEGVQRGLIDDATPEVANAQSYGCGCFWFQKPSPASALPSAPSAAPSDASGGLA